MTTEGKSGTKLFGKLVKIGDSYWSRRQLCFPVYMQQRVSDWRFCFQILNYISLRINSVFLIPSHAGSEQVMNSSVPFLYAKTYPTLNFKFSVTCRSGNEKRRLIQGAFRTVIQNIEK